MRYLLLLLLVGCIDQSADTEVTTIVYQFADITVGDTIPNTAMVWSAEDAREVMRRVDTTHKRSVEHCEHVYYTERDGCYAVRTRELLGAREQYIRELQILGIR